MQEFHIPIGVESHVLMMSALECRGCNAMLTAEMWIPTARGTYVVTCVCGAEYRWRESANAILCHVPARDDEPQRPQHAQAEATGPAHHRDP
jgi:hypothetical protein